MENFDVSEFSAAAVPSANAMPAPTWHRLKASSVDIELPSGLEQVSVAELELDGLLPAEEGGFDAALAAYQEQLSCVKRADDGRAVVVAAKGLEPEGNLDVPALSAYQRKAVLQEIEGNVAAAFATGMGDSLSAYLDSNDDERIVITSDKGCTGTATLRLIAQDGAVNANCIDVVAAPQSTVSLTLSYEAPEEGSGAVVCQLRVFAGADAQVEVHSVQALPDSWTVLDDSGFVLADCARACVTHRVLGAGKAYTGLAADLRGEGSAIDVATRYIGAGEELRDFNYSIKQRGLSTQSNMDANGVLSGASQKTLRGTIDFVYGCKGSTGNERETVLLADESVQNKTVPVILCDEDDVMGNHGATIGHVRPEQRFYLGCRGLSDEAIESLFSVAAIEEAYMAFDDERIKQGIADLAESRGIDARDFTDDEEVA